MGEIIYNEQKEIGGLWEHWRSCFMKWVLFKKHERSIIAKTISSCLQVVFAWRKNVIYLKYFHLSLFKAVKEEVNVCFTKSFIHKATNLPPMRKFS